MIKRGFTRVCDFVRKKQLMSWIVLVIALSITLFRIILLIVDKQIIRFEMDETNFVLSLITSIMSAIFISTQSCDFLAKCSKVIDLRETHNNLSLKEAFAKVSSFDYFD